MPISVVRTTTPAGASGSAVTLSFSGTPAIGNRIIVCAVNYNASGGGTPSISDNASGGSNTYTVHRRAISTTNTADVLIASAPVERTASNLQVTVNINSGAIAAIAFEVSGLLANPVDVNVGGTDDTNPYTLATGALQQAEELIVGAFAYDASSYGTWSIAVNQWSGQTPSTLFINDGNPPQYVGEYGAAAYLLVNSTAPVTASFSSNSDNGRGHPIALVSFMGAGGPPPQIARPVSDNAVGAWTPTPSSPATLWDKIDEASADDADYISTAANSVARVNLQSLQTPQAGAQTLRIRARGSPAKRLIARLLEGANVRATITVDPLTPNVTQYSAAASGITNYGALRIEFEAADATSPPANVVSWGAAGTGATGTTSCTPSYPSGITAASELFCVVTGRSNTANTQPTLPSGWTRIGGLEGGTGTWGVDTGTRRVDIFRKDVVTGSESGTITVSLAGTTANTLYATIFRVEKPASNYTLDVQIATGADATNDTSYSATASSNLSWAANDLLILATAQNIDTGTATGRAVSASGVTFGTITNRVDAATTQGNDHRHIINSVPVSSGSGSSAPTFSYTISAAGSGPTAFLLLRSVPPTEFARVTWAEFEIPSAPSSGPSAMPPDGSGVLITRPGKVWRDLSGVVAANRIIRLGPAQIVVPPQNAALLVRRPGLTWRDLSGVVAASRVIRLGPSQIAIPPQNAALLIRRPGLTWRDLAGIVAAGRVIVSSGGAVYEAGVLEAAGALDLMASSAVLVGALSDAGAVSDGMGGGMSFLSAVSEGAGALEQTDAQRLLTALIAEAAAAADEKTAALAANAHLVDGASSGDQMASSATLVAAMSEAASAQDVANIDGNSYSVAVIETAAAADSVAVQRTTTGGVIEAASAADTLSALLVLAVILDEQANADHVEGSNHSAGAAVVEAGAAFDFYGATGGELVQPQTPPPQPAMRRMGGTMEQFP